MRAATCGVDCENSRNCFSTDSLVSARGRSWRKAGVLTGHERGLDLAYRIGSDGERVYTIHLTSKISRGVEPFYAPMAGQHFENKEVKVGYRAATSKPVGEASRGSL